MPNLEQFPGGQREQEAIRYLLDTQFVGLPQGISGVTAETFDRRYGTASEAYGSGELICGGLYLPAGLVVTRMHLWVVSTPTTATFNRLAIYSHHRQLQAATVDDPTLVDVVGGRTKALAAPFTIPTSGYYYLGWLGLASSTAVILSLESGEPSTSDPFNGGFALSGSITGLSDLPGSFTFGGTADRSKIPWIALS